MGSGVSSGEEQDGPREEGHTILISAPEGPDQSLCPVTWFALNKAFRNKAAKYFFHRCDENPNLMLSSKHPYHVIVRKLKLIGVDSKLFGSHSCRRGGASKAFASKIDLLLIKRHGNWRSDAVYTYITASVQDVLSVSKGILNEADGNFLNEA